MTRSPDEHDPTMPEPHDPSRSPRDARSSRTARPDGAEKPPASVTGSSSGGSPSGTSGGAATPGSSGVDRLLEALTDGSRTAGGRSPLDELALRRLLHDAVREVEPRDDSLDRLSRAVPARRARRRQALIGAAAGVLLVGTAVPAVLHATRPGSTDSAGNVNAASGVTPGGSPATRHGAPAPGVAPGPAGHSPAPAAGTAPGATADPSSAPPGTAAAPPPTGAGGTLTDTPRCARTQLGQGTASTGTPDADGRVYGTFKVVNVSRQSCVVAGPSEISVTTQGDTNPSRIQVVDHTAGDPASGLPDPAEEPAAVILPPGEAYEVQFAWIPASGGGPTGCPVESSPPPTDPSGGTTDDGGSSAGTGDGGTTTDDGGTGAGTDSGTTDAPDSSDGGPSADAAPLDDATGGGTGDTPGPPGSPSPSGDDGIALTTVPPEGGPAAASTDISGACAGTVYQTDPMPTP